jgi:hypothetical protein
VKQRQRATVAAKRAQLSPLGRPAGRLQGAEAVRDCSEFPRTGAIKVKKRLLNRRSDPASDPSFFKENMDKTSLGA